MKIKNILAIIPARGGSKTILKKNIKKMCGKPLIYYPIRLAKSIKAINRIVVSTDSKEIAKVARKFGAYVPFLRPSGLSKDDTPMLPVLQHCIRYLKDNEGYKADLILLLYPTNPLLKKETVMKAINLLKKSRCKSVLSVAEDYGRFWRYNESEKRYCPFYPKNYVNRQYYKPLLRENGAIYFSTHDTLMKNRKSDGKDNRLIDRKSLRVMIMGPDEMVDIDTIDDWKKAEEKMQRSRKR